MRLFPPVVSLALLVVLGIVTVSRGFGPAFTYVDSDFPNYYTASKLVVDGKPVNKLYDDEWFQEQIHEYGIDRQGKFSPFPPATAIVLVPVAGLNPLDALRVVTLFNILLLAGIVVLLSRTLSLHVLDTAVFVFLSGHALINCIRLGQLYLCASFLIVAGLYALRTNRFILSGFCLGLFIPIKYFAIVFVLFFALQRKWELVLSALVTSVAVSVSAILVLGWDIHQEYILAVVGSHLGSNLSTQNPFSATFQSWDSLLRRLMVYDNQLNPAPFVHANHVFPYVKSIVLLGIGWVTMHLALKTFKNPRGEGENLILPLFGLAALLLAPATGTYHYLLLLLPVGLFLSRELTRGNRIIAYAVLGLHAAIGFIPYSFTRVFDGRAILTFLAYPRLAGLLIIYIIVAATIWKQRHQVS